MADIHFKYQFRLILIGDSTVGKSSLLRQFTENRFLEYNDPTVGVDFHARVVEIDGHAIKLQLWDTAGQERFRSITRSYYRNAAGGLLVYDITSRESFLHIRDWLQEARQCAEPHQIQFVLVGHKTDQEAGRVVSTQEGVEFASRHELGFIETSAKSSSNVEEAFSMIAMRLYELVQSGQLVPEDGWDGVKLGMEQEVRTQALRNPHANKQRAGAVESDSKCCG
ncbi:ras-related protein Rab-39B-like [Sycon ciliatum]|uniref:ras-related protein Rab-39B-like n=1 Tax=Sycon ciliatum TaxID=27933 RepID=UPI0020AEAE70|eukprot:scpid76120/ scgid17783/ Ras-related protein Rab-39B